MKNFLNTIIKQIALTRKHEFGSFDLDGFKQELSTKPLLAGKATQLYNEVLKKFFLIAECKQTSPSKGMLQENYHPVEIAQGYEEGGASAISVLTEPDFFHGSPEHLIMVKNAVKLPVLWKDFVIHEEQISHAYKSDASLILLILRITETEKLYRFMDLTLQAGLLPLLEMFINDDFARVIDLYEHYQGKFLLGINNRDLSTFKVDLNHTEKILYKIKEHKLDLPLISESGISTADEVFAVKKMGCAGALVGESLVKTNQPAEAVRDILKLIK